MERKVIRLYTGPDNESHFEEIEIPLAKSKDNAVGSATSIPIQATAIKFRESSASVSDSAWHCVPQRQFYIILDGSIEIQVGDGTIRRFGPGEVFLAEDTTGHGHIARTTGKIRKAVIVTLPEK